MKGFCLLVCHVLHFDHTSVSEEYVLFCPEDGGRTFLRKFDCVPHCHLLADCLDNVGSLTSHNPIGRHGLLRG
jgi:hypothetical protein